MNQSARADIDRFTKRKGNEEMNVGKMENNKETF
jgi:hypothetical protein